MKQSASNESTAQERYFNQCFGFTLLRMLCDWLTNLALLSRPIRSKTKTKTNFAIGKDWFFLLGINLCDFQELVFYWKYDIFVFYLSAFNQNTGETTC